MRHLIFPFLFSFCNLCYGQQFNQAVNLEHSVSDIKIDNNNNIYLLGDVENTTDVDPGSGVNLITPNGTRDIILIKLDSSGSFLWVKQIGGSGSDGANELEIDSNGNIIIAGTFATICDMDPGPGVVNYTASGNCDIFILKLDNNGNYLHSFSITGPSTERVDEIDLSSENDIYITGDFTNAVDFDPSGSNYILSASGNYDFYIAKYSISGAFQWAHKFGSVSNEDSPIITIDKNENVIITGKFQSDFDADPGVGFFNMSSSNSYNYIFSLDSMGLFNWGNSIPNNQNGNLFKDLETDESNGFYAAGQFYGGAYFDPSLVIPQTIATGYPDGVIIKYNSSGLPEWIYQINGDGSNTGIIVNDMVLGNNKIYVTGGYNGTLISIDSTFAPVPSKGLADAFIICITKTGQFCWQKTISGLDQEGGNCLALDNFENLYNSGFHIGLTEFNSDGPSFTLNNQLQTGVTYFSKFDYDPCYTFKVEIDSLKNVGCNQNGYASLFAYNGVKPYQYLWNTTPATNDSICSFTIPDMYTFTITDSINCQISGTVLISGPSETSGFDLLANMVAPGFRSGFTTDIILNGMNDGCLPISGTISIVLDSLVDFNYSIPNPDFSSGDTLKWNFIDFIYDSLFIAPIINVTTTGQIGDTVCFQVWIEPVIGDADSSNNFKTYCFPVVNGYDPNDKQVFPKGDCVPNYVLKDEKLTYTIRFQNTGNSEAINIHIIDTLDQNLDINSLNVIGYSHPIITEVISGNVLNFRYDNIMLPNSGNDQGFVVYEVAPLIGTPDYTMINNTSHIYFDFNPAIITNTVFNTLVDSIPSYSTSENITVCHNSEYTMPDGTVYSNIISPISHQSNLWMVDGCDSIITVNLDVLPIIDTGITIIQEIFGLESQASGMNYQWYDCNTQLPLAGETSQILSPIQPGEYYVVVSNGNCSDTSACYVAGTIGMNEISSNSIQIYPNPAQNEITVFLQNENTTADIEIYSLNGQLLYSVSSQIQSTKISVNEFSSGIYFVKVKTENGIANFKLVKE
jgi:uncharacterized repeat protein (TIGR01451 family)